MPPVPLIEDAVFLDKNTMIELLKRDSFEATEFEVYKIAKAYLDSMKGDVKQSLSMKPIFAVPQLIELTVDFNEMSLKSVDELVDDMFLPQNFVFQLAKKSNQKK